MAVTPENLSLFLNDNYILWTGRQRHQTSEPCDQSDPPTALPVCVCLRERERTKSKKSSKCIQLCQMSQLHLRQNRIRGLKLDPEMLSDHTIFQRIAGACCHCMLVPFVLARVGLQRRFLYRDDTCALECTCRVCFKLRSPSQSLNNKLTSVLVYVWSGRSRPVMACDVKTAVQIRRYPCQSGTINRCKDAKVLSLMTYLIRCLSG